MSATQTVLPAPTLKEAVDNVLHVGRLEGPATAEINLTQSGASGDATVVLHVKTSTGNEWRGPRTFVQLPGVVEVEVPKDVFEKGLIQDASAKLHYVLANPGDNPVVSQELKIQLQK